jgi:hypothetical protein
MNTAIVDARRLITTSTITETTEIKLVRTTAIPEKTEKQFMAMLKRLKGLFDELEKTVGCTTEEDKVGFLDRVKWANKEGDVRNIIQDLQN